MKNWLLTSAEEHPGKLAVISGNDKICYRELAYRTKCIANALQIRGVNHGDRVAVLLKNSLEYVKIIHAMTLLGAILVPLNTKLTKPELTNQLRFIEPAFLIAESKFQNLNTILVKEINYQIDPLENPAFVDEDDPLAMVFTSGTTSQPKAVVLSYKNQFSSAWGSAGILGLEEDDNWLNCISLFHVGGLAIVYRSSIYGTCFTLLPRFEAAEVSSSIKNHGVTLISLVPTMLKALLDHSEFEKVNLRCLLIGGAHCPEDLVQFALDQDLPIALTYGMTEAGSQVATAPPSLVKRKPIVVGSPLPGIGIKIKPIKGEIYGEIVIRGDVVSSGYFKQDKLNQDRFKENEYYTGDLGYLDDESHLIVLQRRQDLIISGGENVLPSEVEEILIQHPGIDELIVLGLEDSTWGQRVVVVLCGSINRSEELVNYCREYLAAYKIPKEFYKAPFLHKTVSGKILRSKSSEFIAEEYKI